MATNSHDGEKDVTDLERRLAGWSPGADGLETDAMLFAAGLAAGRRGNVRIISLTVCGFLAAVATGLGIWGLSERAERLSLAQRIRERSPSINASGPTAVVMIPRILYEPSPDDYLSMRRLLEQDNLPELPAPGPNPPEPPPEPSVPMLGQRDALIDE
jgi:hypothetical protein